MSHDDIKHFDKELSDEEFNAGVDSLFQKLNSFNLNINSYNSSAFLQHYQAYKPNKSETRSFFACHS